MPPIVPRALILLAAAVILLALGVILLPSRAGGRSVHGVLLVVAGLVLGAFVLLMLLLAGP